MRAARAALIDLTPERGDIVDRDGQALARTIDAWTIGLQPSKGHRQQARPGRASWRELMPEKDDGGLSRTCCAPAAISITSAAARRRRLVAAINALGEPGLALEREPDRLYPQTSLAAHVVGFTDIDGKGNAGIERAFDERLRDPAQRGQPIVSQHLQPGPAGAGA